MAYIIEFEKGGRFEIELDPAAPKTGELFLKFMEGLTEPYTALCLQGRFSGEENYFSAPLGMVEGENNIRPKTGDIAFNPNPDWSAICMYWGDDVADKAHYHSLFAHIRGDLEEFNKIGIRIWQKGGEIVTLTNEK